MGKPNLASANIKVLRNKIGLTQEDVAKYLGIQREIISYYETGSRDISLEHYEKLADLFGVELQDLLETDLTLVKVNEAFAFRATEITNEDLKQIVIFRKIVKNHLKMFKALGQDDE